MNGDNFFRGLKGWQGKTNFTYNGEITQYLYTNENDQVENPKLTIQDKQGLGDKRLAQCSCLGRWVLMPK